MTDDLGERLRGIDESYGDGNGDGPSVPRRSRKEDDPRLFHKIDVNHKDLTMQTAQAWTAINHFNTPPHVFASGDVVLRIIGGENDLPIASQTMTIDALKRESDKTTCWMKLMDKGSYMQKEYPPDVVIRNMLADPAPPLPQLRRITRAPVFGAGGTLSTAPGYNPATGHYFDDRGLDVPAVNPKPSSSDVEAALDLLLDDLLGDFPFAGPNDGASEIAHALSLIINPFVRDLIDGPTPMYLIEAPSAGSGKGLLADVAMVPALGGDPVLMPDARNEEELRKRLMGTLMSLPEAVVLDNIAGGLDSPSLASALTAREFSDRVLGQSAIRTVPVRCTWMATGNNPTKTPEMERRTIRIRLDPQAERPEERKNFQHPQLALWARGRRSELVHAVLTIVRGWIAAGMPRSQHVLGSYDDWAAVHGGILGFCDVKGFLGNRSEDRLITVSEDAAWGQLVDQWWELHKTAVVSVSDLYEIVRDIGDFPLGGATTERALRTTFGMRLAKNRGRIFDGRAITFVNAPHRTAKYRLKSTEDAANAALPDF